MSYVYLACQVMYLLSFLIMLYFFTRKVNWVDMRKLKNIPEDKYPNIVLLYPVLRESEETMRTTMLGLSRMVYPKDKFRVIAVPNWDDHETIASLRRLSTEFSFLEMLAVPPTSDPTWNIVWEEWNENDNAYWWNAGKYSGVKALPPKKTRQMIYAFYTLVYQMGDDWLLDYIDADSIPPIDHFLAAAVGIQDYDVLQSTNVAGNLLDTWPASFHAMDHMAWDGFVYPHMSSNGSHPFWMLGKGLFYKAKDLLEVGCFNPWITIEDPEIGMRLWKNGKKLGIIANPLVEEVPLTLKNGIIQRYRWICGFFQSTGGSLEKMGMSFWQRQKARLSLIPVLFLLVNLIGVPTGIWALAQLIADTDVLPYSWVVLSVVNLVSYFVLMFVLYINTWIRTGIVYKKLSSRFEYVLRVNPVFLLIYWLIWCIPIVTGFVMYVFDMGKVWRRTEKLDRNNQLVRGESNL